MKLYVIGPVSGIPMGNRPCFVRAKIKLESVGYSVEIPHDTIAPGTEWSEAMKASIARMLQADGVAMLNGWNASRGARIGYDLARDVGMGAYGAEHWIACAGDYLGR